MMAKLCLMASHGYPPGPGPGPGPGLVFHQEHNRALKDFPPSFPIQGGREEMARVKSLNLRQHQCNELWSPVSAFSNSCKTDSGNGRPLLVDVQGLQHNSVDLSLGITRQYTRREEFMQTLMSGSGELRRGELESSLMSGLMNLEEFPFDVHQQPDSLFFASNNLAAWKPLVDYVGDMARSSKIIVHQNGEVLISGNGAEMRDFLSIVAEFYLAKNLKEGTARSFLVPHFDWYDASDMQGNLIPPVDILTTRAAPSKSPERVKIKTPSRKKNGRKATTERDLYKRSYFHACESLLSLIMDKKQLGKSAIYSLTKSGPELPELLNQFSAGIAGTGIAILLSVVCKIACGRVPFCASKLFDTGLGFGLVWLSWAVNKLRDTIVHVSKNPNKVSMKDEEAIRSIDKSLKDIYFRAATLMAVAMLKFA